MSDSCNQANAVKHLLAAKIKHILGEPDKSILIGYCALHLISKIENTCVKLLGQKGFKVIHIVQERTIRTNQSNSKSHSTKSLNDQWVDFMAEDNFSECSEKFVQQKGTCFSGPSRNFARGIVHWDLLRDNSNSL